MIRLGPERAQYDIGVRARKPLAGAPACCLGHQPGQLAHGVRLRGERPDRGRPRLDGAARDRRFPGVIENERQTGHSRCSVGGRRDLMRPHDQVVAQASRGDRPQSADDVSPAQPVRVRLGLHLVPDADQEACRRGRT